MKYISKTDEEASITNDELNSSYSNGDSGFENINIPIFSSIISKKMI